MNTLFLATAGQNGFTIGNFLSAMQKTITNYGKVIVGIIGLVMFLIGVYQIAKNLISHGKAQTNWVITFALLIVGGALAIGSSWELLNKFSKGSSSTIDSMGGGTADDAQFNDPFGGTPTAIIGGRTVAFE